MWIVCSSFIHTDNHAALFCYYSVLCTCYADNTTSVCLSQLCYYIRSLSNVFTICQYDSSLLFVVHKQSLIMFEYASWELTITMNLVGHSSQSLMTINYNKSQFIQLMQLKSDAQKIEGVVTTQVHNHLTVVLRFTYISCEFPAVFHKNLLRPLEECF